MIGLSALDRLVAGRGGDGLHPRLRALFEDRLAQAGSGVVELDAFRPAGHAQSGPGPACALPADLPDGVVRLRPKPSRFGADRDMETRVTR